mgnify:FL=1
MKKISKGIVFSEDIKRILNGVNAFKFKYSFKPSNSVISEVREDFRRDVNNIFDEVIIISEEDMMRVNDLIGGGYPHRNFG